MRISLGLLAAIFLALGLFSMWQPTFSPFWEGMLVRVGSLLAVIWLAFPQLSGMRQKFPAILIGAALVALVLIAARPNQGRLFIGLLSAALVVTGVLKWLARHTGAPDRRRD